MENRILIAYATKAGSTAGIARRVGEVLARRGAPADVLPVPDIPPLNEVGDPVKYRAVVLGSAIRFGKLLPEAMAFIELNQEALQEVQFSIFIACMTLVINPDEEGRRTVDSYLEPVRALVQPASQGKFAGVMDLARLRFGERLLMRFLRIPRGDFRQWDEIESWAEGIPVGEKKENSYTD